MAITLRNVKGSALTHSELDANFTDITSSMVNSGSITGDTLTLHKSGSTIEIDLSGLGGSGGTYTNATPTPVDFPNSDNPSIPAGSTFDAVSFAEMMDLMLYPTLNPTLTAPSSTFSISPSGFQEIGDVINITLSATFSKGSISPAYAGGPSERSGDPFKYFYTGTGTSDSVNNQLADGQTVSSYTVLTGTQSWTNAVSHSAGLQPLDSDGNDYDNPYPAGVTPTITRNITGVYPVYATTSNITTLTKQSLQSMSTYIQVSMEGEDNSGNKQTIDIPDAWNEGNGIVDIQQQDLQGNWQSILSSFDVDDNITKDVNNNATGVGYKRYTHNGVKTGARELRFTV